MNKTIIVYDDYNSNIPKDQNVIGTVTTTFGHTAIRNGWKIIEVEDEQDNRGEGSRS